MMRLNRRRFLTISAGASLLGGGLLAASPLRAAPLYQWRGVAMGSAATIALDHPDAAQITARMQAEISRLEDIFSLYRASSALSRLNAAGSLAAPPFELLECLSLAGRVHQATGGLFDPTVQPLWELYAREQMQGRRPDTAALAAVMPRIGWAQARLEGAKITLGEGQALTLNGIAQGYVADRIAALLRAEGLANVLIDTGEISAMGLDPTGAAWPVQIASGPRIALTDRALATSAPLGTVFDEAGTLGHILSPATGLPAPAVWRQVSVSCPSAALADALSTAACLMADRAAIDASLSQFADTRLEYIA